ncbi:hypothetical protein [Marispirochaeta sp.]|uniref:hypothetical protein n=1 Tax=Marispirochaeta sp. TaxID=2038653 RepID=UPI0029C6A64F|nr:hypothetical protein [Marispirochaeta sp.]
MQAVEYGFSAVLPGGSFPVALLFLEIDPELVDFNIHPAKREARIRNMQEVHHAVSSGIQDALAVPKREGSFKRTEAFRNLPGFDRIDRSDSAAEKSVKKGFMPSGNPGSWGMSSRHYPERSSRIKNLDSWSETAPSPRIGQEASDAQQRIRYLGQAFDLFLLCQVNDELYLIDQHAAHERILYNRFSAPAQESQGLVVPLEIEISKQENRDFYNELLTELRELGFRGSLKDDQLLITAIPASYRGVEKELAAFLGEAGGSIRNLLTALYADMACKAAIKDGESLDEVSARELARETLALPDPRCPHGRPVWFRLSREELFAFVGRT